MTTKSQLSTPPSNETQSVGAAEGCDLLIFNPANLSEISFKMLSHT